jgi:general secretion pathway protein G
MIVARRVARTNRLARRAAFTLMEVMVVVAILVILASVGSVAVFKYLEDANESKAKLQIANIETAVKAHKIKNGEFPQSLEVLTVMEGGKPAALDANDIRDPWGKEYQYLPGTTNTKGTPKIMTTTPNGLVIANWE